MNVTAWIALLLLTAASLLGTETVARAAEPVAGKLAAANAYDQLPPAIDVVFHTSAALENDEPFQ